MVAKLMKMEKKKEYPKEKFDKYLADDFSRFK